MNDPVAPPPADGMPDNLGVYVAPASPGTKALSPSRRIVRTAIMVILGIGGAIPAAVAKMGIPATTAAEASGIAGGVVMLVAVGWNAYEAASG